MSAPAMARTVAVRSSAQSEVRRRREARPGFSGLATVRPTLSRRVPYAVHMHGAVTGRFIGLKTRRSHNSREPPPTIGTLVGVSRA